ncbi:MAG: sigma-70 family RNA polymerase sigma factor [Oscillospiraceae bacterium]|nr:sigma-70 family RNA polymerase sigma factor [Oscillospiraceae bacterium]MBP1570970.1 sigma-70 family RNA polymerase sigma factor [Oscillospiraceae bacterium]MBQ5313083.1 sigma-70 family RNA polymerase sigma factor [Oscillospiraceae bacterium]
MANILFLALHLESRVLPDPLTPKQEKEEFDKYFNGDMAARDKLIRHNLRLVAHVAKKYYQGPIEQDDLMSIGTIGLVKAVQSFSMEKNIRFSTYASKCIQNEILMALRKNNGSDNIVYLEESIDNEDKNGKLTLKDSLQDDFEIEEFCESQEIKNELLKTVAEKLDGRERQIIIMRYGLFGNPAQTQQQVCETLGISRSYVSRLEKKAINILKEHFIYEK